MLTEFWITCPDDDGHRNRFIQEIERQVSKAGCDFEYRAGAPGFFNPRKKWLVFVDTPQSSPGGMTLPKLLGKPGEAMYWAMKFGQVITLYREVPPV